MTNEEMKRSIEGQIGRIFTDYFGPRIAPLLQLDANTREKEKRKVMLGFLEQEFPKLASLMTDHYALGG